MKTDLSAELKTLLILRVKAHISITQPLRKDITYYGKQLSLLNKIFEELEDNQTFWITMVANFYSWEFIIYNPHLIKYYDAIQKWYHQYSIQERKKNEWLDFDYLEWKSEKVSYNEMVENMFKTCYKRLDKLTY